MHETFVRLCEIRSPTGEEREVADTIAAELRALGLEVSEDDAAGPAEAGAGNSARAAARARAIAWVMFCAHIDTVPHRGQIEVVESDGVFRSAGETILGADNKAAVAVFMELVARHAAEPPPVGIELVLTVAEEQGLRGAKAFDASTLRSDCGFVLDHASADRRGDRHLADPAAGAAPTSPGSRPTPASAPRTAATRSPPPRRRSRAWSWAGSTRRRPPTSA